MGHSKMFAQDYRVLTPPPPPLNRPCAFSKTPSASPPPSKVCSFWLELPLSPSISIFVKSIEKKLIVSTSIFG